MWAPKSYISLAEHFRILEEQKKEEEEKKVREVLGQDWETDSGIGDSPPPTPSTPGIGKSFDICQYEQNKQYEQDEIYEQNKQYEQKQYEQDKQYEQNKQYDQNKQYEQNTKYNLNTQYDENRQSGKYYQEIVSHDRLFNKPQEDCIEDLYLHDNGKQYYHY